MAHVHGSGCIYTYPDCGEERPLLSCECRVCPSHSAPTPEAVERVARALEGAVEDLGWVATWLNHGPLTLCYCDACGAKRLPEALALIDDAINRARAALAAMRGEGG